MPPSSATICGRGCKTLGQIAAVAPEDVANWLRLARTIFQIRPVDSSEQTFLLERASTAAYIAYQRAANAGDEADALAVLGQALADRKLWRPALDALRLSLDLREVADVRGAVREAARRARLPAAGLYGRFRFGLAARLLPVFRGPRQARPISRRSWCSAGNDKPALTAEDKQLCVEGLKHGERYNVNAARRAAVDGQGDPAEIGRIQHLCARPQAVRALHRPRLCAAAHRPARHSAGQRQYAGGRRSRSSGSATAT